LTVTGSLRRRVTDPTGGVFAQEGIIPSTPPPKRTTVMEVFSDGENALPESKHDSQPQQSTSETPEQTDSPTSQGPMRESPSLPSAIRESPLTGMKN